MKQLNESRDSLTIPLPSMPLILSSFFAPSLKITSTGGKDLSREQRDYHVSTQFPHQPSATFLTPVFRPISLFNILVAHFQPCLPSSARPRLLVSVPTLQHLLSYYKSPFHHVGTPAGPCNWVTTWDERVFSSRRASL
jgi:hypothetical protein